MVVLSSVELYGVRRNWAIIGVAVLVLAYLIFRPHWKLRYTEYEIDAVQDKTQATKAVASFNSQSECDRGQERHKLTYSDVLRRLPNSPVRLPVRIEIKTETTYICKPEYRLMWGW